MELIIKHVDGKDLGLLDNGTFGPLDKARLFTRRERTEARRLAKLHGASIDDDDRVFGISACDDE